MPDRQLFVDLDGVLADFDSGHEAVFGMRPCKQADNVDWKAVRAVPGFYENLPPMPDMQELWGHVGGVWITHKSAEQTINALSEVGL